MADTGFVARVSASARWTYVRGAETVASAYAVRRPDRRWTLSIDAWDADAREDLLAAALADLRQPVQMRLSADDTDEVERWLRLGFRPARYELELEIPVDPELTGLGDAAPPAGIVLLGADAVDVDRLRLLDDEVRRDVPGSDGWVNDPQEFRDYTFETYRFDAATYLVALDDTAPAFAGLVRVWPIPKQPRLGLVGVARAYRRRGLARALLAAAFAPVHARGVATVSAEADETNTASLALLTGIGARVTGRAVELVRAPDHEHPRR